MISAPHTRETVTERGVSAKYDGTFGGVSDGGFFRHLEAELAANIPSLLPGETPSSESDF
jgi:hypothetical protein